MKDVGVTTSRLSQVSGSRIAPLIRTSNAEPTPICKWYWSTIYYIPNGHPPLLWFWLDWQKFFRISQSRICEIPIRQNKASDKRLLCPSPPNRIKNASAWTLVQIYVFYGKKLSMIWKIYFLKLVFSWRNHSNSSKLFFTSQFISIDTFFKKIWKPT